MALIVVKIKGNTVAYLYKAGEVLGRERMA